MFSVALCVIATGRYNDFLPPLLRSVERFFCVDFHPRVFVFTDRVPSSHRAESNAAVFYHADHEPWPGPTLHRYHTILQAASKLASYDYVFYCDVDMRFAAHVADEIFGDLVAVQHPGFVGKPPTELPFERRLTSACCVPPRNGRVYYAGAFQGGRSTRWLDAATRMRDMIDRDAAKGVTPKYHDESAWNALLSREPPTLVLPPTYCHPEPIEVPRIIALNKDHQAMRGT